VGNCPLFLMATGTRKQAIQSMINMWLKTEVMTCATCGEPYVEGVSCCDFPVIGNNVDTLKIFLKELKKIKETRANKFASNKDKSLRFGVSMPVNLYNFLDKAMRKLYNERLFNDTHGTVWFAKNFPQFCVPEEI
jgi:hypothetical protein